MAPGVHVLFGSQDGLTTANGAAIANAGFIVGEREVLAVETGPTARYADAMLAAIDRVTGLPVRRAVVTHRHPDHAFGIGAFRAAGVEVLMHPAEAAGLLAEGPRLLELMTELVGAEWTGGTAVAPPTAEVGEDLVLDLGGRKVDVAVFPGGHTKGDLVVLDRRTGTAFLGDLVFVRRAATVPHADIGVWLAHLDRLAGLGWKVAVPGHGPPVRDRSGFEDTRRWLGYLRARVARAVLTGESPAEILDPGVPAEFGGLAEAGPVFGRSVLQLYRRYERMDPAALEAWAAEAPSGEGGG